ncbi:MAG: hypothetical protein AAF125_19540, partial [Chloroflexota bacterium]
MATATANTKRAQGTPITETLLRFLIDQWSWVFLILLIAIITAINPVFLTPRSISSMLVSSTLILLMALGQTFVIITAGIDLSIGWTVGLASVITATIMRDLGDAGYA